MNKKNFYVWLYYQYEYARVRIKCNANSHFFLFLNIPLTFVYVFHLFVTTLVSATVHICACFSLHFIFVMLFCAFLLHLTRIVFCEFLYKNRNILPTKLYTLTDSNYIEMLLTINRGRRLHEYLILFVRSFRSFVRCRVYFMCEHFVTYFLDLRCFIIMCAGCGIAPILSGHSSQLPSKVRVFVCTRLRVCVCVCAHTNNKLCCEFSDILGSVNAETICEAVGFRVFANFVFVPVTEGRRGQYMTIWEARAVQNVPSQLF